MNADNGETVFSAWSGDDGQFFETTGGGGVVELHYGEVPLAPGRYQYWVCLADPAQGPFPVDYYDMWSAQTGHDTDVFVEGATRRRARQAARALGRGGSVTRLRSRSARTSFARSTRSPATA